jgi:hypothetical protein
MKYAREGFWGRDDSGMAKSKQGQHAGRMAPLIVAKGVVLVCKSFPRRTLRSTQVPLLQNFTAKD